MAIEAFACPCGARVFTGDKKCRECGMSKKKIISAVLEEHSRQHKAVLVNARQNLDKVEKDLNRLKIENDLMRKLV